jgi:X-domain of DnaJ-containing
MSSVGRAIGEAMHNPTNETEPEKTPEEKLAEEAGAREERTERVRMLVENLAYKLDLYALDEDLVDRMDRWRARCKLETDELKNERFGSEILKVNSLPFDWS